MGANLDSIADADVSENVALSDYTTFQLGGPCRRMVTCKAPMALIEVARQLAAAGEPYILIGGGSNLLVSDHGFDGTIVRYVRDFFKVVRSGELITVPGCTSLDALAEYTAQEGLEGLMCCTGIPGTVGGAIVGNAGAWGKQIADVLKSAILVSSSGDMGEAGPEDLGFSYRRSRLQETNTIVAGARFNLIKGDATRQLDERAEILKTRAEKHPDLSVDPCIGSIFRNIEPTSAADKRQAAGWFLEEAGVKGMKIGGAEIFEKHANIIVKRNGCTAQNVRDLIDQMKDAVRAKFDMELVREVRLLGSFEGEEDQPANRFF